MATKAHDAETRHKVKAARNQALLREVNERIDLAVQATEHAGFICECGDLRCNATLDLTILEYESVRASSVRFRVKPGHEILAIERVVERNSHYLMVEKLAEGAAASQGLDSRSR